ncbi:E3 ubiquitin-protein ligase TRIM23-like [Neocloeon triangulifer]|uniref:E3 ubiquitin-protein ligase TRIM23-like n=1 Tax=Neocloeon triangulifer TaxID=2078957 RepID=UPI00286F52EF|nr:E3 ubiquitin-protein ligase TRIM23-like [Neocloeon triangulifer]
MNSNKLNVLECRVCEDVFGPSGERVPRLLHCGHTVCHSCLLRLPLQHGDVLCPFDRQPTPTGESGVWGLKKNFALLELLERLQSERLPSTSASASTTGLSRLLDGNLPDRQMCDEDETHVAVVYCVVCGSHLCEECSERTHATRTLGRHRRVPLAEKPRERAKCAFHPSHVAEFACLEQACQQNPLMCFVCKDYGRHKGHQHGLVETEAESLRQNVLSAVSNMRQFMDTLGESVHKIEVAVQRMEGGTVEEARNRVRTHFQQLRESLEQQENAACTALEAHTRERLCALKQLQEDLTITMSHVASVCVQCSQLCSQDDSRLLTAGQELKEALTAVEQQQQQFVDLPPEQRHPDPAVPVTFTKDNRVHMGPRMEMRVVTLGLDGAGKTSILFKLKQDEFVAATPTIGFNVESLELRSDLQLTVWDVGGQPKLRPLWKHYYLNTQAVVFVVDCACRDRLPEAQSELAKLIAERELKDAALLVLANKQDIEGSISAEELCQQMALPKLCCGRSWHCQSCSAQTGNGLTEGLEWLSRQLTTETSQ